MSKHNWTKIGDHGAVEVMEGEGEEGRDITSIRTLSESSGNSLVALTCSELADLTRWIRKNNPKVWEMAQNDNPKTLARVTPVGVFHMSDDQTEEANNVEMIEVLGDGYEYLTYGEQADKVREALKPYDQTFELVPHQGWMRSNNHPTHMVAVWTSIRQTVKYILTTEPPKPKTPA